MTAITTPTDTVATKDIVSPRIKVLWSSGALGVYFMMNTVAAFAVFYMVAVLKIEPALAGLIAFLPKIFDAFTDPIVGCLLYTSPSPRD